MIKNTLLKAVEAGGKELKHFFNGSFTISSKGSLNDLVTEADHAAEKAIFKVIQEAFPTHFILSEETGEIKQDSKIKWIIDPIDGTINFANGIPICCVSIGVEDEGKMILGAVYNPIMNELFIAEKGKGATLNGNKISETFVKWDKEKKKCFAGFVVSGENVGVNETITVSGEALSFLSTGIDTRVYYIKNF